jgi:hypothetical protein
MRVKLLIALALASIVLLVFAGPALAGNGPFLPQCGAIVSTPVCPPINTVAQAQITPCFFTPATVNLEPCPTHGPCNVPFTCPTFLATATLTGPGNIAFTPPGFVCPNVLGPTFNGPQFQCPTLFDPA